MTPETLLHRQVHPSWLQEGRVTSQVFKPTPKDKKRVSVYDGDQITAPKSWRHFTDILCFESVGVLAVSVNECTTQESPVESDPEPFLEHVVIKFDDCSTSQIEKKAKHLKRAADTRGWQFRVDTGV